MKRKLEGTLFALSLLMAGCFSQQKNITADTTTELIHKPKVSILLDEKTPVCGPNAEFDKNPSQASIIIDQPLTETASLVFRSELERANGKWLCKSIEDRIVQPAGQNDDLNWNNLTTHIWEGIALDPNTELSITVTFEQTDTKDYFISKFYTLSLDDLFACENPLVEQQLGEQFNDNVYTMNPYINSQTSYIEN